MKTSRLLTITILALFVGFVYLLVDSLARKPVTDPESRPSTFFTDETGARASFLLLREVLGSSSVEQIKEPLWSLAPPDQGGPSTVIVAGPAIGLLPLEAEQLEYWVSEGGQLVLFLDDDWVVEDSVPLLSRFGVSFRTDDGKERVVALKSPARSLRVERKASFKGEFDALVEGEEEILAVAISSGEGRVVVFPDPVGPVLTRMPFGLRMS